MFATNHPKDVVYDRSSMSLVSTKAWDDLLDWMRRSGVDPNQAQCIERRDGQWLATLYVWDENDRPTLDESGTEAATTVVPFEPDGPPPWQL